MVLEGQKVKRTNVGIRFCMPEKDGRDLPDHNPIRIDRLGWDLFDHQSYDFSGGGLDS